MDIKPISSSQQPGQVHMERDAPAARPAAIALDTASAVKPVSAAVAADELAKAVRQINKSLQASNQGVEFSVDADSKRTVVKVVDQETQQVLRQMPTQEALDIAKALDRNQGVLIRQEA